MKAGCILAALSAACILTAAAADRTSGVNPHRVMILDLSARNKTGNTELAALEHCFDIFAIQYSVTQSVDTASASPLVFTAGDLRNTTFAPAELQKLYSYVENGGVLISQVVIGNKLFPLFGIKDVSDSRSRYSITFAERSIDKALSYIDRPEERTVSIGNAKIYKDTIWTHAFSVTGAKVLASTGGRPVFSVNRYGEGLAYALGVSLSDTVLLPHVGNDFEAQRGWINSFEPGADVFLLLMKAVYEEYTKPSVQLSAIPYGQKTALILTHDVDAQDSFPNMVEYAELEKRFGVSATYFITTKYFTDASDRGYYDSRGAEFTRRVKSLGGDIGSHTVSHSITLDKFPDGSASVTRSSYRPETAPTLFGEVKVSKEILDRDIPQNTVSYRSGYLRYPERLIDILEKSGYLYDSSFSANDIMTNFAYRAFRIRGVGSGSSQVIEIPVIFDDSQGLLTPKNMKELVAKWVDVIMANADNGAISVLLIHPSEAGYKLKSEENLLTQLGGKDIWIGNLTQYGDFWRARSALDYECTGDGTNLTIRIRTDAPDERISFVAGNLAGNVRVIDAKNRVVEYERNTEGGRTVLRMKKKNLPK
jgi:peptidoglycan/xylan/chitin deacetylase (PgdA/CDA1 family)